MKFKFFFPFLIIGLLYSCSQDKDDNNLIGEWSLIQQTGGFAGVNCEYEQGQVTWTFDYNQLTIETMNLDPTTLCGGISINATNASYSILEQDGQQFLVLEQGEMGRINLSGNTLRIDQNESSSGTGADGFQMTLER